MKVTLLQLDLYGLAQASSGLALVTGSEEEYKRAYALIQHALDATSREENPSPGGLVSRLMFHLRSSGIVLLECQELVLNVPKPKAWEKSRLGRDLVFECPDCGQQVLVDDDGRLQAHSPPERKEQCPGSGKDVDQFGFRH